jgi:hypothetical protein
MHSAGSTDAVSRMHKSSAAKTPLQDDNLDFSLSYA